MMKSVLLKFVPNLLSLLNGLFGGVAIWLISGGVAHLETATTVLLLGSIPCDMLDGFAARKLDAKSAIGADLDSLADIVSFGVAPALMTVAALSRAGFFFPPLALLIIPFSVYRLAKFNHDDRQKESFLGLPTPANAVFFFGWSAWISETGTVTDLWGTLIVLSFCAFLVSEIPMFGIKNFGRWKPVYKALLLLWIVAAIAGVVVWGYAAFVPCVVLYLIVSLVLFAFSPKRGDPVA